MPLSELLRDYLAEELAIVAKKIREANNPVDKNYFFTAVYGAILRVFNIEYDPSLVLMYRIFFVAYQEIETRIQAIREHAQESIRTDLDAVFTELSDLIQELSNRIRNGQDARDILERVNVLAYSTTGNGFYLQSTGRLR